MTPFIPRSHQFLMLTLILLEGRPCDAVRTCQFDDSTFFLEDDVEGQDTSAGECLFDEYKFCSYSQACTDKDAKDWTLKNGKAVCPGKNGAFASFSVLLSPLLKFNQNYCLKFNYSQSSPGKLSVFLATSSWLIDIKAEEEGEGSFSRLVNIRRSVGKIGFKARSPNGNQEITLSFVKLQSGNCGSVPDCSTVSGEILRHCAWNVSFPPERQGDNEASTGRSGLHRHAGVIAGTLGYVFILLVVLIVGVIFWRRFKQKEKRSDFGEKVTSNRAVVVETSQTPAGLPQLRPVERKKSSHRNSVSGSAAEDEHTYAEIDGAALYAISRPFDVKELDDGCPGRKRSGSQTCLDATSVLPSGVNKKNIKDCSSKEIRDCKLSLQTKVSHPYYNTKATDVSASKPPREGYSMAHSCTEKSANRDVPSSRDDKHGGEHVVHSDGYVAFEAKKIPDDVSRGDNGYVVCQRSGTEEREYERPQQVMPYSVLTYDSDRSRAASSKGERMYKAYDHTAPRGNGCYDTALHLESPKCSVIDSDYSHI